MAFLLLWEEEEDEEEEEDKSLHMSVKRVMVFEESVPWFSSQIKSGKLGKI